MLEKYYIIILGRVSTNNFVNKCFLSQLDKNCIITLDKMNKNNFYVMNRVFHLYFPPFFYIIFSVLNEQFCIYFFIFSMQIRKIYNNLSRVRKNNVVNRIFLSFEPFFNRTIIQSNLLNKRIKFFTIKRVTIYIYIS